jgi:hypothetical protein
MRMKMIRSTIKNNSKSDAFTFLLLLLMINLDLKGTGKIRINANIVIVVGLVWRVRIGRVMMSWYFENPYKIRYHRICGWILSRTGSIIGT